MALVRIAILGVAAYLAYLRFSWKGVGAVVLIYIVLYFAIPAIISMLQAASRPLSARQARHRSTELITRKLSDAEKTHLAAAQEHERAMHDHKAQFNPELRKQR